MKNRKQLITMAMMVCAHAIAAFCTYAFFADRLAASSGMAMPDLGVSNAVLGLANAGIVVVVYGAIGLAGYWLARRLGLPGIYREGAGLRALALVPLAIGLLAGVGLVVSDLVFAPFNGIGKLEHPVFPVSILASLSAGIGEEVAFRAFVMGLWALVLNWLLRRWDKRALALWVANILAALVFAAGHIGTVLAITGATDIAMLSPVLLAEILLLNGVLGIVAGRQYIKNGLIAAVGVHFWTDVVFHVVYGLVG